MTGIIHRGIKPDNILVGERNVVKIADFGTAARTLGYRGPREICGTPEYMSPEMLAGETYNAKTDIWAVGCMLYELCTAKHPFDGQSLWRRLDGRPLTGVLTW